MDNYCKYCNKTLSDFEVQHIALHHPDKQLCRPCFVYRQPESQLQKPPLTDEQKAAERERYRAMIDRLKALAEEQTK